MSEPRKSRREAKPTQRLKEFLGEEAAIKRAFSPKAVKTAAKSTAAKEKEIKASSSKSASNVSPAKETLVKSSNNAAKTEPPTPKAAKEAQTRGRPAQNAKTASPGKNTAQLPSAKGAAKTPAAKGATLTPAAKGAAQIPSAKGTANLPLAKGIAPAVAAKGAAQASSAKTATQAPAVKSTSQSSSPKCTAQIPAAKSAAQSPTMKGIAEAPIAKGASSIPAAKGSAHTPAGKGSAQSLAGKGSVQASAGKGSAQTPAGKGTAQAPAAKGTPQTLAVKGAAQTPAAKGTAQGSQAKWAIQTPVAKGAAQSPTLDKTAATSKTTQPLSPVEIASNSRKIFSKEVKKATANVKSPTSAPTKLIAPTPTKSVTVSSKAKFESEPDIVTVKRVSKPSAKISEAMETEALMAEVTSKKLTTTKLTPATKVTLPVPKGLIAKIGTAASFGQSPTVPAFSTSASSSSVPSTRGALRGRGRGRGRPPKHAKLEVEESIFDKSLTEDSDKDDDDDEEAMDVDVEEPPRKQIKLAVAKKTLQTASVSPKRDVNIGIPKLSTQSTLLKSKSTASTTGTPTGPVIKKVLVNAGSPVSIAATLQRSKPTEPVASPIKVSESAADKEQVVVTKGGIKRVITTTTFESPSKKAKLDRTAETEKEAVESSPSSKPNEAAQAMAAVLKRSPIKVITTTAAVTSTVKKVATPVRGAASTPSLPAAGSNPIKVVRTSAGVANVMKSASALRITSPAKPDKEAPKSASKLLASSSGSDTEGTRRSRRQPKPTARLKEFLHRSSEDEETAVDDALLDGDDDDDINEDDLDADYDSDEEMSPRPKPSFLSKSNVSKILGSKGTLGRLSNIKQLSSPKSPVIKTQVIRKVSAQDDMKLLQSGSPVKPKYFQLKTEQFKTSPKGLVQLKSIAASSSNRLNGNALKGLQVEQRKNPVKISTAGGPCREIPIVIKISTVDPEEIALKKKRLEEESKKLGPRKIIIVNTNAERARQRRLEKAARLDALGSDSESIPSEEDSDSVGPEAFGERVFSRVMRTEKIPPLPEKSRKMLKLGADAVSVLKQRLKLYKESDTVDKAIERKSLVKFISLSEQVMFSIKQSIEDDPEGVSEAENFKDYCREMLDSIAFKKDKDDLTAAEAGALLKWLRFKIQSAGIAGATPSRQSELLDFYAQLLQLLTSTKMPGRPNLSTQNKSKQQPDLDEEEEMDMEEVEEEGDYDEFGETFDEEVEEEEPDDMLDEGEDMMDEEEDEDDEDAEESRSAATGRR